MSGRSGRGVQELQELQNENETASNAKPGSRNSDTDNKVLLSDGDLFCNS
jgi:hypothetical protein